MRRIYKEVAALAEKESWTYRDILALLLAEEVARRKQTRLQRCTRNAHSPSFKTIDEFDFTLQSTLRQSLLGSHLGPDFVTEGQSVSRHPERLRDAVHDRSGTHRRSLDASKKGHLQESLTTCTHPHELVIDEVGYLTYGRTLPTSCSMW